uniref:Uncharacterized protein n=1 Tax=Manihot esculenta TaxID=3983 RepID=A0A2C9VHZ3_MANES
MLEKFNQALERRSIRIITSDLMKFSFMAFTPIILSHRRQSYIAVSTVEATGIMSFHSKFSVGFSSYAHSIVSIMLWFLVLVK